MTKKDTLTALQQKLAYDARWAIRALLAIFKNQTEDEKDAAAVKDYNEKGFRCMDAEILTSFARQVHNRRELSGKQMTVVHRLMPRYARQLMKFHGDKIQASFAMR
jgi:hypothetical protein